MSVPGIGVLSALAYVSTVRIQGASADHHP
jgi:hypothetical protein